MLMNSKGLILYWPWHSEIELLGKYQTYQHHYIDVREVIKDNVRQFNQHNNELDEATECFVENGPPGMAWDSVVPAAEEDNG